MYTTIDPSMRENYTCPYLPLPSEKYLSSMTKILICGKETNGWGEKEGYDTLLRADPENWETVRRDLLKLYDDKINKNWAHDLGSIWPFYNAVRELTEVNPKENNIPYFQNVGLCAANVALLGYPNEWRGFDGSLTVPLAESFAMLHDALSPNLTICTVGYKQSNYTAILERALGIKYSDFTFYEFKVIDSRTYTLWRLELDEVRETDGRYYFCFGMLYKGNELIIIAPHPERKSKVKLEAFVDFIRHLLTQNLLADLRSA